MQANTPALKGVLETSTHAFPPVAKLTLRNTHLQHTLECGFHGDDYVTRLETDSAKVVLVFPQDFTSKFGATLKLEDLQGNRVSRMNLVNCETVLTFEALLSGG